MSNGKSHVFPGPLVVGANLNVNDAIYVRLQNADLNQVCSDSNDHQGGGQDHINSLLAGVDTATKDVNGLPSLPDGYTPSADLSAAVSAYQTWKQSHHKPGPHHKGA